MRLLFVSRVLPASTSVSVFFYVAKCALFLLSFNVRNVNGNEETEMKQNLRETLQLPPLSTLCAYCMKWFDYHKTHCESVSLFGDSGGGLAKTWLLLRIKKKTHFWNANNAKFQASVGDSMQSGNIKYGTILVRHLEVKQSTCNL